MRPNFTKKVSEGVKSYMNETLRIGLQSKAVRIPALVREGDGRHADARTTDASDDDSDNESDDEDESDGDCLLWASLAWRAALAGVADTRSLLPHSLLHKVGLRSASGEEIQTNIQTVLRLASTAAATTEAVSTAGEVDVRGKKKRRSSKDAAQASRDAVSHGELSRFPGWSLSATAAGHHGDRDTHMVPLLRATLLSGAAATVPVSHFDACLWCVAAADIATTSCLSPLCGSDSSFRLLHYVQLLRALSVAASEGSVTSDPSSFSASSTSASEPLVVAAVALQLAARILRRCGDVSSNRRAGGLDDDDGDDGRAKRRRIGDLPSSSTYSPSPPSSSLTCASLVHPLVGALCAVADSYFARHLLHLQGCVDPPGGGLSSAERSSKDFVSTLCSVAASASACAHRPPTSSSSKIGSTSNNGGASDHHCIQAVALVAVTHQQLATMAREDKTIADHNGKAKYKEGVSDSSLLRCRVDRAHPLLRLLVRAASDTDTNTNIAAAGASAAAGDSVLGLLEQASAVVHCCRPGPLARLLRTQLLLALGPEDVGGGGQCSVEQAVATTGAGATYQLSLQQRTERLGCDIAQELLADTVAGIGAKKSKGAIKAAMSSGGQSCGSDGDSSRGSGSESGNGSCSVVDGDDLLLCRALQTLVVTIPRTGGDTYNRNDGGLSNFDRLPQRHSSRPRQWPADKALHDFISFLEAEG